MCDRSKVEILARELCIEFYAGKKTVTNDLPSISTFTDSNWREWENIAITLLETLEKHT